MAVGLINLGNAKHYLASSGAMATGWAYDEKRGCCYADYNGELLSGWQLIDGSYYWMEPSTAAIQTGWMQIGRATYHLSNSGARDSSCRIDDSDSCSNYLNVDGVMAVKVTGDEIAFTDGSHSSDGLKQIGDA